MSWDRFEYVLWKSGYHCEVLMILQVAHMIVGRWGSPYENSKMKDMILYYQMTQCLDSGRSKYGISKNSGWGNGDLETFLKKFVAEAQYAKRVRKNHLFSPSYYQRADIVLHGL